ncbi:MAG: hypothetical protein ACI81L_001857 [Verrucomicrobiales bacterium]|jgi:hypothetical protein
MSTAQKSAFSTLLDAWRRHQQLRSSGPDIAELTNSRLRLDEARLRMHTVR